MPVVIRLLTCSVLLPLILFDSHPMPARVEERGIYMTVDSIKPLGTPEQQRTIDSLLVLAGRSSGLAWRAIDTLRRSRNLFTIRLADSNSFTFTSPNGAQLLQRLEEGLPVNQWDYHGSGGVITINPGDGIQFTTAGQQLDPVMNLLHELVGHGILANRGALRTGEKKGLEIQEWQATHIENQLRAAAGKPLRRYYKKRLALDTVTNEKIIFPRKPRLLKGGRKSVFVKGYDYLEESSNL